MSWRKTHTRTVDHTTESLGLPAWLPRSPQGAPPAERWQAGVIPTGPLGVARGEILTALAKAREVVLMTSFLLNDEELVQVLLDAAARGVRVYLLTAARERLEREKEEDRERHRLLLERLAGRVLVRSADAFHSKTVLVDPPMGPGFLLTANLAKDALTKNEELVVKLDRASATALRELFVAAFWRLAEHELLGQRDSQSRRLDPASRREVGRLAPEGRLLLTSTGHAAQVQDVVSLVDKARSRVLAACYGWQTGHPVVNALAKHAREGCAVTALARVREKTSPVLAELRRAGAVVLGFEWLHAKAIWVDDGSQHGRGLVTSANFERLGLDEGFELGIVLDGEAAGALRDVLEAWAKSAKAELALEAKVGDIVPRPAPTNGRVPWDLQWARDGAPELRRVVVENERVENLKEQVASSAELTDPTWPSPPPFRAGERIFRRTVQHVTVVAPRLQRNASREPGDHQGLPAFREPGGRVVIGVTSPAELDRAQAQRKEVGAAAIVVIEGVERGQR